MNFISRFAMLVFSVFIMASCTSPYESGLVEEKGQISRNSFDGLIDVLARGDAKMVWVHGMCSHGEGWAQTRHRKIVSLTGGRTTGERTYHSDNKAFVVKYTDEIKGNSLESRYLVWSPLTKSAKGPLTYDTSLDYHRASINEALKGQLMNDCLADAVAYIGAPGDEIRRWMKSEVCDAIGGQVSSSGACVLSNSYKRQPLLLVSESLGSIMLTDAVSEIWRSATPSQKGQTAQRLSDVQLVFLIANQIPILEVARHTRNKRSAVSLDQDMQLGRILSQARQQILRSADKQIPLNPLRFVEFTDPNDVLSYRLISGINFPSEVSLTNVTVSNAPTIFGLLENPIDAHCGYEWNAQVLGVILYGYNGNRIVPVTGQIEKNKCL